MLQIALLLNGQQFIRHNLYLLILAGFIWGVMGGLILADGLLGAQYFPLGLFGWLLLSESILTLLASSGSQGTKRTILVFKGGGLFVSALLILSGGSGSNLLLAIIFGFFCFLSGVFVIASAWVVRFSHWRRAIAGGLLQVLFAFFLFQPYPAHHDGTVPQFIGVLMLSSAISCILLSVRLHHLQPGMTIFDIQSTREPLPERTTMAPNPVPPPLPQSGALIVHVWTPEGSSKGPVIPRPVLGRYIASVDTNGVISTGHAALEMQDIYISLYPSVDIDRSPSEFFRTLRAVRENDVPGEFKHDYVSETAAWCNADRQVVFNTFDAEALRTFYRHYRQKEIYNLTRRNCSSSVAFALEAALDGALYKGSGWGGFFRLFLQPELWIAAQLRKWAINMAWTPGLVLDYSRALHGLIHPVKISWFKKSVRLMLRNRKIS